MRQLIYVITFTGRLDEMRRFYERGLRLPVRHAEKDWVEFDTAGASLALHRMDDPDAQGMMLRFATGDLDAALEDLRRRGLEPDSGIATLAAGRLAAFQDADGNPITLLEPAMPIPSGAGSPIQTVTVHVGDMVAATGFYRDQFGLHAQLQSPWWTQFDTGATQFALHPRVAATEELRHNAQRVVVGFEVPDLEVLARELASRKLRFSGGPVEQRYGTFAEVTDPDGYVVLFRRTDPRRPLSPEAEAYEDDAPTRGKMRPPRKKTAHSASRVAVKPAYHEKKRGAAARKSKRPSRPAKKRPRSAKPGAASGRLHKSERRSAERKRTAVAAVSRRKPVKRAATRRGGRGRA